MCGFDQYHFEINVFWFLFIIQTWQLAYFTSNGIEDIVKNIVNFFRKSDESLLNSNFEVLDKLIIDNAGQYERKSKQNRYTEAMKMFSSLSYLQAGAGFYKILAANSAFPSLSTVAQYNRGFCSRLKSGMLDLEGFKQYCEEVGATCAVISEDASRLKSNIPYDSTSNELVGLVSPNDHITGLPLQEDFKVKKPSDILQYLQNFKRAKFVLIIMAQPLVLNSEPYILGYFPTNTEYKAKDFLHRWSSMSDELLRLGIRTVISTDGASSMFCAQKYLNGFGHIYGSFGYTFLADSQSFKNPSRIPAIQDTLHLVNNMRNRICNPSNPILIGNFHVTSSHHMILLNNSNVSKLDHQLSATIIGSDLTKDKMNTEGTAKMCAPKVVELLQCHVRHSQGTQLYLTIMHCQLDAYTRENIDPKTRLFNAVFVISVVRRWYNDVTIRKLNKDHFITKQSWETLELNLVFLLQSVQAGLSHLIPICSSQACEKTFRTLRSLSPLESTQINFDLYELISKIQKVKTIKFLMQKLQQIGFKFNEQLISKDSTTVCYAPLTNTECMKVISSAVAKAKSECLLVGITCEESDFLSNFLAS